MNNADMPAIPIVNSDGAAVRYGTAGLTADGLTKREIVAMHMMAHLMPDQNFESYASQAKSAVLAADALLAELGRTK